MSGQLQDVIRAELDRLAAQLAAQLAAERLSAGDTRLWAIALLTETAYCFRAVRAAGLMRGDDIVVLLADAAEVIFSEPERPVRVVQSPPVPEKGGKPN